MVMGSLLGRLTNMFAVAFRSPPIAEPPWPDLSRCRTLNTAKAVQAAALRHKQESVAALLRIEAKAQIALGFAAVVALALVTTRGVHAGLEAALVGVARGWLFGGALFAGAALRVGRLALLESEEVIFFQPAFDETEKDESERVYLLTSAAAAMQAAVQIQEAASHKAHLARRGENGIAIGAVVGLLVLAGVVSGNATSAPEKDPHTRVQ